MLPVKFSVLSASIATAAVSVAAVVVAAPVFALPLSPGDRMRITVPSDQALPETERLGISGTYEIGPDGNLKFPLLEPIPAVGREPEQVEQDVFNGLVSKGIFKRDYLKLSLSVVQWAPVQVNIAGETFRPGRVLINALPSQTDDRSPQNRPPITTDSGEYPPERYITAALRLAGGVKPEADLKNVRLVRNKQEKIVNLAGIVTGEPIEDVPLIAGDQVIVPKTNLPQYNLVRPSQVTPSIITVYLANLTEPARPGAEATEIRYGTRFSQAAIAAGCAGGNKPLNARRRVSLIQSDQLTGRTTVLDRSIEQLIRTSKDNSDNPFLMPEDSVVCYDSTVTNITGVLRTISTIFNPLLILQELFFK